MSGILAAIAAPLFVACVYAIGERSIRCGLTVFAIMFGFGTLFALLSIV